MNAAASWGRRRRRRSTAARTAQEPFPPTPEPVLSLGEVACRYQAGEIWPEGLPMIVAEALAAGLDTPAWCDLAVLPRRADARDIHEMFERALAGSGIDLPDPGLARRHRLRRLAGRLAEGEIVLAGLATFDSEETVAETAEERAFLALVPPCGCCIAYTTGPDLRTWAADLRIAARALALSPPVGPGC